jgi:hypothetical protein
MMLASANEERNRDRMRVRTQGFTMLLPRAAGVLRNPGTPPDVLVARPRRPAPGDKVR